MSTIQHLQPENPGQSSDKESLEIPNQPEKSLKVPISDEENTPVSIQSLTDSTHWRGWTLDTIQNPVPDPVDE